CTRSVSTPEGSSARPSSDTNAGLSPASSAITWMARGSFSMAWPSLARQSNSQPMNDLSPRSAHGYWARKTCEIKAKVVPKSDRTGCQGLEPTQVQRSHTPPRRLTGSGRRVRAYPRALAEMARARHYGESDAVRLSRRGASGPTLRNDELDEEGPRPRIGRPEQVGELVHGLGPP